MYGGSMSPMGNNRSYDRPYQGGLFTSPSFYNQQEAEETAYLHVPSYSVGAIIGAKGTNIRNIMKFPGASLKIAPEEQPPQDSADSHPARHNNQQTLRKLYQSVGSASLARLRHSGRLSISSLTR